VSAADVAIASEVSDLDTVGRSLGLDRFVLLGHSWGGVIAMAYTVSHPRHVSGLVLMNCAPPSAEGAELFASSVSADRTDEHKAALAALRNRPDFRAGDVDADAEYYRLHFAGALRSIEAVDSLVARLRVNVAADGIALARAIEERLYDETWRSPDFDLIPSLRGASMPDAGHPWRSRLHTRPHCSHDRRGDTGRSARGLRRLWALRLHRTLRTLPTIAHRLPGARLNRLFGQLLDPGRSPSAGRG
jgi:pimeloyl-ACP methyl ester carboxylesterase